MAVRHYCFLSYGVWKNNPGQIHPRMLGAELLRRGVRVTYVVDDYPQNHEDLATPPGARVVFVPSPQSAGQVLARRRILRELAPDFVHIKDPNFRSFAAVRGSGQPPFVLDWDEPHLFAARGWLRVRFMRGVTRWLVTHARQVVATNRRLQQYAAEQFGVQAAYMPYAVYLEPQPGGPSPYDRPTAAYMGSMHPRWDIDLMWDAFRVLAAEGFKSPVALVGQAADGPWAARARAEGLDHLQFPGRLSDAEMWRYLRHAQVLLFPIRPTFDNETRCPSKTLVYAQVRRPVITSRVGEVAAMLGDQGIYVDPTPAAMAAALRKVMESPRPADVEYRIEERYNYKDRADELLKLLEQ